LFFSSLSRVSSLLKQKNEHQSCCYNNNDDEPISKIRTRLPDYQNLFFFFFIFCLSFPSIAMGSQPVIVSPRISLALFPAHYVAVLSNSNLTIIFNHSINLGLGFVLFFFNFNWFGIFIYLLIFRVLEVSANWFELEKIGLGSRI
jgi:hypothetical protein